MQAVSRALQDTTNLPESYTVRLRRALLARRPFLTEHALSVGFYLLVSVLLTWPLVRNFDTLLMGSGDARHHLWTLWYTKHALLTDAAFYSTDLLYYPHGVSLIVNALGPLTGLLALPFWVLGPIAAYNGAVLIGFVTSGYFMYLLARTIGLEPAPSLVAGLLLSVMPLHLLALEGHLTKVFIGMPPLTLLLFYRALHTSHGRRWALGAGLALWLTLLHTAEQFVFTGLALAFLVIYELVTSRRERWGGILLASALTAGVAILLAAPILLQFLNLVQTEEGVDVARHLQSVQHQPDLIQFFKPPEFSRFLGPVFDFVGEGYIKAPIETTIYLSWTGLLLALAALWSRSRSARRWITFTLFFALLALGPFLQFRGETHFTDFELPIVLPYAFLTSWPGMDFLRTPGRLMILGSVGFGLSAGIGFAWLLRNRTSGMRYGATSIVTLLILLEIWPKPWVMEAQPTPPEFYEQIGGERDEYGVFDLPIRPYRTPDFGGWYVYFSSFYQYFQMTHGKGIASGYVDRPFEYAPLFAAWLSNSLNDSATEPLIQVDGEPARRFANAERLLAQNGYRYVVYHKPQHGLQGHEPGGWGVHSSRAFLGEVFSGREPLINDDRTIVYTVDPDADDRPFTTTLLLQQDQLSAWIEATIDEFQVVEELRLSAASDMDQMTSLEFIPERIERVDPWQVLDSAVVTLIDAQGNETTATIHSGQPTVLPLQLIQGDQTVVLRFHQTEGDARIRVVPRTLHLKTSMDGAR